VGGRRKFQKKYKKPDFQVLLQLIKKKGLFWRPFFWTGFDFDQLKCVEPCSDTLRPASSDTAQPGVDSAQPESSRGISYKAICLSTRISFFFDDPVVRLKLLFLRIRGGRRILQGC